MGCGFGISAAGPWMILIMIFKILIMVGLVFLVIKMLTKYDKNKNEALQVLNIKYINGEIDEEEYAKKKAFIKQK